MNEVEANRLEELTDVLLHEGALCEEDAAELRSLLATSKEARERYLLRCELEMAIGDIAALGGIRIVAASPRQQARGKSSLYRNLTGIAVAAAIMLAFGTWWLVSNQVESQKTPELVKTPPADHHAVPPGNADELSPKQEASPVKTEEPTVAEVVIEKPIQKAVPLPVPDPFDDKPKTIVAEKTGKEMEPGPILEEMISTDRLGSVRRVTGEENNWTKAADVFGGEYTVSPEARVEIELYGGVIVAVEGPSRFALIDHAHVRLISGRLAAEVSPGAEGFRVDANAIEVIDLGTKFAVSANTKGDAAVHVYKGHVTAGLAGQKPPLTLDVGRTVRLNLKESKLDPMLFRQDLFASPPLRTGALLSHSESVIPLDKPPREITEELASKLIVFQERSGLTLRRDIPIDIGSTQSPDSQKILKGTKVSSYLVHLSPTTDKMSNQGMVRFDGQVLGIQKSESSLKGSDRQLGAKGVQPEVIYEAPARGLEENEDPVTVLDDGFSVQIAMRAVPPGTDQIRIIVAED